jgi:hypothetical protein
MPLSATVSVHVPKTEGAAARTRRLRSVMCGGDCCADERVDARANAARLDFGTSGRSSGAVGKDAERTDG